MAELVEDETAPTVMAVIGGDCWSRRVGAGTDWLPDL